MEVALRVMGIWAQLIALIVHLLRTPYLFSVGIADRISIVTAAVYSQESKWLQSP